MFGVRVQCKVDGVSVRCWGLGLVLGVRCSGLGLDLGSGLTRVRVRC